MKLAALTIKNFGCFDDAGCTIKIDDIVVLIGQNNTGKSTVLDAYEAFASMGGKLPLSSFREENIENTISIEGVFTDISTDDTNTMGVACVYADAEYGESIKVKFEWKKPEEDGKKFTYNGVSNEYQAGGAGGWDTLLQSRIPFPLRIKPTDTPADLEKIITEILTSAIKQKLKADNRKIESLIAQVKSITEEFAGEIEGEINTTCASISEKLATVFPSYSVKLIPDGKLEAEKILGAGTHVRLVQADKPSLPLKNQGSGVQRTFLWSAISALAEIGRLKQGKKSLDPEKPRILLIDEPEAFLHPPVIRSAREALYSLAQLENWQVMASTHSSVFIDVAKPHTTIIRLEKDEHFSTKIISTDRLNFNAEERKRLAMIRSCNSTVNEFFFSDTVLLVEGETEQLVFTTLLKSEGKENKYHIVNCLGKGNVELFAKILNHFQVKYIVIHDSDSPKAKRKDNWIKNAAWTTNTNILDITLQSNKDSYCIVQVPDFEGHYFGEKFKVDKPYSAYKILTSEDFISSPQYQKLRDFVAGIENNSHPNKYNSREQLTNMVELWVKESSPTPAEQWELNSES